MTTNNAEFAVRTLAYRLGMQGHLSNKWYTATRRLSDLLDILIAVRMDVGQSANEPDASPVLASEKLRVMRVLLDDAIASAKEIFESVYYSEASRASDIVQPLRRTPQSGRADRRGACGLLLDGALADARRRRSDA